MNFFVKPKEQSETRFGFALARKSLLKTNFQLIKPSAVSKHETAVIILSFMLQNSNLL